MAKGENIFKRKDGRWEARYVKGYELSGKIKYGFCYLYMLCATQGFLSPYTAVRFLILFHRADHFIYVAI